MPDPALDVLERSTGIALEPVPIERLGHNPQLDDQVFGEVFGFDFATFFPPEPDESGFVLAHDNPRIGATDESTPAILEHLILRRAISALPV